MKRKVVLQKVLATVMALSMAAGVSISNVQMVKADDSDPFAFDSVSDVTFPLKEKLNLTVFVNAPTTYFLVWNLGYYTRSFQTTGRNRNTHRIGKTAFI